MRRLATGVVVAAALLMIAAPTVSAAVDKVICVPWQGDPAKQHTAISGVAAQLKAVVRTTDTGTIWYRWVFGDGNQTAVSSTSGSTSYNMATTHVYTAPVDTPFTATLQVDDVDASMSNAVEDTYLLKVQEDNLDSEVNVAIDRALWYLYTHHSVSGSYWYWASYSSYYASPTSSAVQSFEINNHLESGDVDQDPYVEAVQRGLAYLLGNRLTTYTLSAQTYGNPDANGNGIGIYTIESNPMYTGGAIMDALIASRTPDAVATVGPANIIGRTYKEIVQDMCDMYAYWQGDAASGLNCGGWRYGFSANSQGDNSSCQWAAIGMIPAEANWGCVIPQFVKDRNNIWLSYTYNAGGLYFGYTSTGAGNSSSQACRPSGMVQMVMSAGAGYKTDPRWVGCESWFANSSNWAWFVNTRSHYAWYAFVKAMRLSNTTNLSSGFNWYRGTNGIAPLLVNTQESDGSWIQNGQSTHPGYYGDNFVTSWSVIMLRPTLFQAGPVAHFTAGPNPTYSDSVISFDPSTSGHSEGGKDIGNLTKFEWDWDNDGVYDEETPGPSMATHSYTVPLVELPKTFPVTLRVTDDAVPPLVATYTLDIEISNPPHPPVADANGPYMVSQCPADSLTVDGSASFDPNEGEHEAGNPSAPNDTITAWDWDFVPPITDFSDASGAVVTLTAPQVASTFPSLGSHNVGLQVTDNTLLSYPSSGQPNLTDADFTTVMVYPACQGCDLTASAGCNSVVLEWTVAGTYDVLRSTEGPNSGFQVIGNTTGLGYADLNVVNGTTYWYRLTDGQCLTTFAQITYQSDLAQCLLIDDLTARPKNALVQLKWSHLAGTAYYRVYRSQTSPCEIVPANLLLDNLVTTYCIAIDTTCVNNVTYYYKVVAISALTGQPAGLSNEVDAMPHELTIPPPPSEAPIPVTITSATLDRAWVYQNYGQAANLHGATLTVEVDAGELDEEYEVTVQATQNAGSVVIVPSADPHSWTIQGGAYNTTDAAAVDVEVQVLGLTTGYRDNKTVALEVRSLGDVDGNGVIDLSDKLEINRFLNGVETDATESHLDLTGDGVVNTIDKLMINRLLNGMPLE